MLIYVVSTVGTVLDFESWPQLWFQIEDYSSILLGVFGGLSLLSSILVVFLPETTNTALADTLEDTEDRKKTKTICVNMDKSETCHKGQECSPSDQECDTEHWRHHMMTSSHGNGSRITVPLRRNPPITGGFPRKGPVMWSFDVFFVVHLKPGWKSQLPGI